MVVIVLMALSNGMSHFSGNKSAYDKSSDTVSEETQIISVQVPVGEDECIGKNYSDIEEIFLNKGFTNISFEQTEDLKAMEAEKVGQVENVSIDGNTEFEKDQIFQVDAKVVISYHVYAKCTVNVHINFIPNLMFSKYDVDFTFDGVDEGVLTHGKSEDYQLTVDPGEYLIGFISKDSSSVGGETMLKVEGDCNVSYKIECHKDEISIEVEYKENLDDIGENEVMIHSSMADYKHNNYKDVEEELKKLGFTNIKTKILYDIELGWTNEGETESVSINGKDDFKRGDIFADSDEVIITYHMKAEDDPLKEKEDKTTENTDTKAKKNEEEIPEEKLTVDNCPELAAILSNKAEMDPSYSDFASKYKGRTIEFNGRIDYCSHYKNYDTRFDYLVSAGDYDPDHQVGPSFKFENVNYSDLHTNMGTVSVGLNVRIIAEVRSYDSNSGLFYLKPISVNKR